MVIRKLIGNPDFLAVLYEKDLISIVNFDTFLKQKINYTRAKRLGDEHVNILIILEEQIF